MEISGSEGVLAKALKDVLMHWESTSRVWSDAARADFDKEYMEGLIPAVRSASIAVLKVEEILRAARKDCS